MAAAEDPWVRWDWVADHGGDIGAAVVDHVALTLGSLLAGLAVSALLVAAVRRWPRLETPVLAGAGLLYTVPSVALFALLVPWTGLSPTSAVIGLTTYNLLVLVRSIVLGLEAVPGEVEEAARGMGMTPAARLWRVEVPLALPVIAGGLRVAAVTTIGLVTVSALIGQGGLGQLILDGLVRDFRTPLVVGTTLSVVLAMAADGALVAATRLLTPWSAGSGRIRGRPAP